MNYPTTAKHFEVFQDEVLRLIRLFNLGDWKPYFHHQKASRQEFASCETDLEARCAAFYFNTTWETFEPTLTKVKAVAKHEVFELLLAELETLARYRFINPDQVRTACHGVIRRLEKFDF